MLGGTTHYLHPVRWKNVEDYCSVYARATRLQPPRPITLVTGQTVRNAGGWHELESAWNKSVAEFAARTGIGRDDAVHDRQLLCRGCRTTRFEGARDSHSHQ